MKIKKHYVRPQVVAVECECHTMLAISNIGYSDERADKGTEVLSNDRRGSWGNLWE